MAPIETLNLHQTTKIKSFIEQQNFRPAQTESICRLQNEGDWKFEICIGNGRKIVGIGENAGNQHFLLFPQYFQKPSLSRLLKVAIVW